MKSFMITVPDNKENLFIEMMKNITFIEDIQIASDKEIPNEHKEIVCNRMKRMKERPESCLSWDDMENKIRL